MHQNKFTGIQPVYSLYLTLWKGHYSLRIDIQILKQNLHCIDIQKKKKTALTTEMSEEPGHVTGDFSTLGQTWADIDPISGSLAYTS